MANSGRMPMLTRVHARVSSRTQGEHGGIGTVRPVALLLPLVLVAGLLLGRPALPRVFGEPPVAVAGASSARTQLDNGAAAMATAIARGFGFTVVSRSTLYARPGGPGIEVPDPSDPYTVAGTVDSLYLGGSAATGTVRGGDLLLQMYGGDIAPEGPVEIAALEPTLAALVTGGTSWRNDGEGWYAVPVELLPGIGLDPRTVALLPGLLAHAQRPATAAATVLGGRALPTVTATGSVADAPGLMASDAAPFTVLVQPISFVFDDQGRLAQLAAVMRNTRMADADLLVTATITFDYASPGAIPAPAPTAPPPAAPDAGPTATPEATR